MSKIKSILTSLKGTKLYRAVILLSNSAIVGFLITLVIFSFEQYEEYNRTKDITNKLEDIANNLSTQYLGLFPDYLNRINGLFEKAEFQDSVIIFEDVLYYGIMSKPDEFKKLHRKLLSMSDEGSHVAIAYYDTRGRNFKRMMLDQYVASQYLAEMDRKRRNFPRQDGNGRKYSFRELRSADSLLCEQYFSMTRAEMPEKFRGIVDAYRKPIPLDTETGDGLDLEIEELYGKIDSVKQYWLRKDYDKILLSDFEKMYRGISDLLAEGYLRHGVELIPIDENLSMSCWLVAGKAILAFPSKYATDEIGFFSQDPAFSKYICTMLDGFRGNYAQLE